MLKCLLGAATTDGDVASQVADAMGRIETMETRLAAIVQEIEAATGSEIEEHHVARALEAFGPVWDSLWPSERARILGLLVREIRYDGLERRVAVTLQHIGIWALAAGGSPAGSP